MAKAKRIKNLNNGQEFASVAVNGAHILAATPLNAKAAKPAKSAKPATAKKPGSRLATPVPHAIAPTPPAAAKKKQKRVKKALMSALRAVEPPAVNPTKAKPAKLKKRAGNPDVLAFAPQEPASPPGDPMPDHGLPPIGLILAGLGIGSADLERPGAVAVSAPYLRFLLQRALVAPSVVDEAWYEHCYLDVRAAILAEKLASGAQHFFASGWLEGRLPRAMAFDPVWYYQYYKDLQSVFSAADHTGLAKHFYTRGYFEGRAGTKACVAGVQGWQLEAE